MDLFVIDMDDSRDRWEELYRTVERALTNPASRAPGRPLRAQGCELDPLELLHAAYWNGA